MKKVFLLMHEYDERYHKRNRRLYAFDSKEKAKIKQKELEQNEDLWETHFHTYKISELPIK